MKEVNVNKKESLMDKEVLKKAIAGADTSPQEAHCSCEICNLRADNEASPSEGKLHNQR